MEETEIFLTRRLARKPKTPPNVGTDIAVMWANEAGRPVAKAATVERIGEPAREEERGRRGDGGIGEHRL